MQPGARQSIPTCIEQQQAGSYLAFSVAMRLGFQPSVSSSAAQKLAGFAQYGSFQIEITLHNQRRGVPYREELDPPHDLFVEVVDDGYFTTTYPGFSLILGMDFLKHYRLVPLGNSYQLKPLTRNCRKVP